jgi:hypothetical protein
MVGENDQGFDVKGITRFNPPQAFAQSIHRPRLGQQRPAMSGNHREEISAARLEGASIAHAGW